MRKDCDRPHHRETGEALVRAMADLRVRDVVMEHPRITPSVRDVEL